MSYNKSAWQEFKSGLKGLLWFINLKFGLWIKAIVFSVALGFCIWLGFVFFSLNFFLGLVAAVLGALFFGKKLFVG